MGCCRHRPVQFRIPRLPPSSRFSCS
jgi:hypothetical protein